VPVVAAWPLTVAPVAAVVVVAVTVFPLRLFDRRAKIPFRPFCPRRKIPAWASATIMREQNPATINNKTRFELPDIFHLLRTAPCRPIVYRRFPRGRSRRSIRHSKKRGPMQVAHNVLRPTIVIPSLPNWRLERGSDTGIASESLPVGQNTNRRNNQTPVSGQNCSGPRRILSLGLIPPALTTYPVSY